MPFREPLQIRSRLPFTAAGDDAEPEMYLLCLGFMT